MHRHLNRRTFLSGAICGTALAALPARWATAQTVANRLEWNAFKLTAAYPSFINAISTMRANTNASSRNSWQYWSNIHAAACPHSKPYFLAWHRGFLHYFQQTLRTVSGNSTLMVPYWDYYQNPVLPAEFSDPAANNPLYVAGRVSTNVRSGLTLTPFSNTYLNFQRGTTNAFETSIEYKPHGSFHNLIGGHMATLNSPMDPIFWLHHGMIDRLWAAWVATGNGRTMPASSNTYWSGNHVYRSDLTMPRLHTYNTTTPLGYTYANLSMPTSLPPAAQAKSKLVRVQDPGSRGVPRVAGAAAVPPADLGGNRRSLGGARGLRLDETATAVGIAVAAADTELLGTVLDERAAPPAGRGIRFRSAQVTLNDVATLPAGAAGGYFYDVYLLPAGATPEDSYWIGSFGPFEIESAHHNGARISFPATRVLRNFAAMARGEVRVAFVRVTGDNPPAGALVDIGEVRAELSQEAPE